MAGEQILSSGLHAAPAPQHCLLAPTHDPGLTRSRAALHLALLFQDSGSLVPPRTHVMEPARFPHAHGQPGLSDPHGLTHSDRAPLHLNTQQLPSSCQGPASRPGPSALSVEITRSVTETRIEIPFLWRPSSKTPGTPSFLSSGPAWHLTLTASSQPPSLALPQSPPPLLQRTPSPPLLPQHPSLPLSGSREGLFIPTGGGAQATWGFLQEIT